MKLGRLASGLMAATLALGMAGVGRESTPVAHGAPEPSLGPVEWYGDLTGQLLSPILSPGDTLEVWIPERLIEPAGEVITWEWFCNDRSLWSGPGAILERTPETLQAKQTSRITIPTQAVGCLISVIASITVDGVTYSSHSDEFPVQAIEVDWDPEMPPVWTMDDTDPLMVGYDLASVKEGGVKFTNWGPTPVLGLHCEVGLDFNGIVAFQITAQPSSNLGSGESTSVRLRPVPGLPEGFYSSTVQCGDSEGNEYSAPTHFTVLGGADLWAPSGINVFWVGETHHISLTPFPHDAEMDLTWMCQDKAGDYRIAPNNTGKPTYTFTVDDVGCEMFVDVTVRAPGFRPYTGTRGVGSVSGIKVEPFRMEIWEFEIGYDKVDTKEAVFTNLTERTVAVEFDCFPFYGRPLALECDLPTKTQLEPEERVTARLTPMTHLTAGDYYSDARVTYLYDGEEYIVGAGTGVVVKSPLENMDWWGRFVEPLPEDLTGVDEKPSEGMVLEPWMIQAAIAVVVALGAAIVLLVILLGRSRRRASGH